MNTDTKQRVAVTCGAGLGKGGIVEAQKELTRQMIATRDCNFGIFRRRGARSLGEGAGQTGEGDGGAAGGAGWGHMRQVCGLFVGSDTVYSDMWR